MPPFNPSVPSTNDPNYLGYSNPPSANLYTGNKTAGVALEGIGNVFKAGVEGLDTLTKTKIDDALHAQVDQERGNLTGSLEAAAGVDPTQRIGNQPDLLAPTSGTDAPADIHPQLEAAQSSVTGMTMNGKIMPLHYLANLDTIAKNLRAENPGYRDYIDTKMAAITGGTPANEYYKELITGLNAATANTKTDREKAMTLLTQNLGVPGALQGIRNIEAGVVDKPMTYASSLIAKSKEQDYRHTQLLNSLEESKGTRADVAAKAKDALAIIAGDEASNSYNQFDTSVRLHLGDKNIEGASFGDMTDYLGKVARGEIKVPNNDEAALAIGSAMKAMRVSAFNRYLAKSGKFAIASQDPAAAKAAFDAAFAGMDQIINDLVVDKNLGMAARHMNDNKAIIEDTSNDVLKNSDFDVQQAFRMGSVVNKLGGPNAAGIVWQNLIQGGITGKVRAYMDFQKGKLATQQDPNKVFTLKDALQNLKKRGIGVDVPDPNNPNKKPDPQKRTERQLNQELVDFPSTLANPNIADPMKINIAKAAFDPANRGITSEFAQDVIVNQPDGSTTVIPGSHMVFDKMTTKPIADEVYRLSQNGHPELWENYKNWVQHEHRALFQSDMLELNNIPNDPRIVLAYNDNPNNPGWTAKYTNKPLFSSAPASTFSPEDKSRLDRKIAMANSNLRALVDIAKKDGSDPNAYVLETMVAEGVDPAGVGLPSKMVQALQNSKMGANGEKPRTIEDIPVEKGEDTSKIKGAANAAKIGSEWGNPLDTGNFSSQHLTQISTPTGRTVTVNKKAAPAFQGFLRDLENEGYSIESIGGYNLKTKKSDASSLSQHAFGNAIDINPSRNPYHTSQTDMPKNISALAARWGISWGGDWSEKQKDPMHFEFTGKIPTQGEPGYKLADNK